MNTEKNTISKLSLETILLSDIRAALHDLIDEQKKTNKILREIFGGEE